MTLSKRPNVIVKRICHAAILFLLGSANKIPITIFTLFYSFFHPFAAKIDSNLDASQVTNIGMIEIAAEMLEVLYPILFNHI